MRKFILSVSVDITMSVWRKVHGSWFRLVVRFHLVDIVHKGSRGVLKNQSVWLMMNCLLLVNSILLVIRSPWWIRILARDEYWNVRKFGRIEAIVHKSKLNAKKAGSSSKLIREKNKLCLKFPKCHINNVFSKYFRLEIALFIFLLFFFADFIAHRDSCST